MKRSVLIKLSSALIASASMLSLSGIGNTPVNASLVMKSVTILGDSVIIPIKIAWGVTKPIVIPAALFTALGAYGINELLSHLTDEQFQLFSLDSIKAELGYSSKGNNLVGVSVGQLSNLVQYARCKAANETFPVNLKNVSSDNLLCLVKVGNEKTWSIDGLEEIDLEYLLDRYNDDNYVITKEDILDTLINSRKDFGKIFSKQKDKVNSLFMNLFTNKVF